MELDVVHSSNMENFNDNKVVNTLDELVEVKKL